MSWGTHRRNTILLTAFLLIFVPISLISFLIFYTPPSCFDGKQNQDETGIDCGGSCVLLCTDQVTDPVVLWERSFKVVDGLYNVMAYIENPNPTAFVQNIPYSFKLYNEERVLIAERKGVTSILPKSVLPIIENNIQTFEQVPARVSFEFEGDFVYERTDPRDSIILIKDEVFENEQTNPRIRARIQNISLQPINDIDVIVIVYNAFDTVVGVSSTYVDRLSPEQTRDIVFTWPEPLSDTHSRIEIIPLYDLR